MKPHNAELAISGAVQRMTQYLEEWPVQSIAEALSQDRFRATIDQVMEELQFMLLTSSR